ncbi:hypothetical protein [Synechococcus sp. M16CYN]|uniref:hypothetical protein n=1 Tax=Synechococcus sp. M16CYN TaxID=3103139 RepID=UPI003254E90B
MELKRPIIWLHEEALGTANPAFKSYPEAPGLFVFDQVWIEMQRISRKRLGFLYECCLDLPITIRKGDVAAEVLAFAERCGADGVVSSRAVDPRIKRIGDAINRECPLRMLDGETFVELAHPPRLGRFSHYWHDAEPAIWQHYGVRH